MNQILFLKLLSTKNKGKKVMNRKTLTTIIKARGGKIIAKSSIHCCYQFKSEDDLNELRPQIPFLTLQIDDTRLNVFFDRLA